MTQTDHQTLSAGQGKDPRKDRHEFNKLRKRLRRQAGKAIADFNMIEPDDRIMVCISGGKDSYAMLELLMALRDSAPIDFELVAVTLDQKQPGYPEEVLPQYLETLGIPFYILERDTYSVVRSVIPEGKTTCGLCSRLRRGTLYGFAEQIGASKIALGHHRDDIVETLFLNLFFGGKLKAMPAKLKSDDGRHVVIRPLAYCRESDLEAYARRDGVPHHSLQSMWYSGKSAAPGDQANAQGLGAGVPRPNRDDFPGPGECCPLAPSRSRPVRLSRVLASRLMTLWVCPISGLSICDASSGQSGWY